MGITKAIKMMERRINWLNNKSAERRKSGDVFSLYEAEAAACRKAVQALELMRVQEGNRGTDSDA